MIASVSDGSTFMTQIDLLYNSHATIFDLALAYDAIDPWGGDNPPETDS